MWPCPCVSSSCSPHTLWQCGKCGRRARAKARGAGRGHFLFKSDTVLTRGLTFPLPSLYVNLYLHGSVLCVMPAHVSGTLFVTSYTCPWPFTSLSSFTNSRVCRRTEDTRAQQGPVSVCGRGPVFCHPDRGFSVTL